MPTVSQVMSDEDKEYFAGVFRNAINAKTAKEMIGDAIDSLIKEIPEDARDQVLRRWKDFKSRNKDKQKEDEWEKQDEYICVMVQRRVENLPLLQWRSCTAKRKRADSALGLYVANLPSHLLAPQPTRLECPNLTLPSGQQPPSRTSL